MLRKLAFVLVFVMVASGTWAVDARYPEVNDWVRIYQFNPQCQCIEDYVGQIASIDDTLICENVTLIEAAMQNSSVLNVEWDGYHRNQTRLMCFGKIALLRMEILAQPPSTHKA